MILPVRTIAHLPQTPTHHFTEQRLEKDFSLARGVTHAGAHQSLRRETAATMPVNAEKIEVRNHAVAIRSIRRPAVA
jgi:hypothetical protein